MTRAGVRRLVAAYALLLVAAPPARAHQTDPTIVTRIDAVAPELPGVTIEVRSGVADQLLVVNTTPTPLVVVASGGEPFLRIGRTTVEANVRSPDWYASNSPLGPLRVPPQATGESPPDWQVVSRTGSWGWFDHRLHPATRPLTPELRAAKRVVRLADWTIPFEYGATAGRISGHVEYRPVLGTFRSAVERVPAGATADVLDGRVPGLFLRWAGPGTLVVRGIAGEPFARLTPAGAEVNDASPTWQDDQRLRGSPLPASPADPKAAPRWHRVGDTPQLTWLDRRLAYAPGFPPDDVTTAARPTVLVEWDVPVEAGGAPGHLAGTTSWLPARTANQHGGNVFLYVAVSAGALAALVLLRLRARP